MNPDAPAPLPEHARALLAEYRDAEDIPAAVRARIHRRLRDPAAAGPPTRAPERTVWIWTAVAVAAATVLMFAVRGLLPSTAVRAPDDASIEAPDRAQPRPRDGEAELGAPRSQANAAVPEPASLPVITPGPAPQLASPDDPSIPAEPGTRRPAAQPTKPTPTPEPGDAIEGERALIAAAWTSLARGQPQRALDHAAAHATRFPTGVLGQERDAIEAIASCRTGHDGADRVAAFVRSYPRSPLASRVREACEKK